MRFSVIAPIESLTEWAVDSAAMGRSGKQKHAADDGNDFAKFCRQLAALGLSVRTVEGDGNCLFRAIADQLGGTHREWRRKVCAHMRSDPDSFAPFIVVEDGDEEEDADFATYLARMGRNAEWGGHLELSALRDAVPCDVVVHNFGAPRYVLRCATAASDAGAPRRACHLAYVSGMHYDSVRGAADDGSGPALPLPKQLLGAPAAAAEEDDTPLDGHGAHVKECSLCPSNALVHRALLLAKGAPELPSAPSPSGSSGKEDKTKKKKTARRRPRRIGKRKPCPCQSGEKYMNCCRDRDMAARGGETIEEEKKGGGRRGARGKKGKVKVKTRGRPSAAPGSDDDGVTDAFGSLAI